MQRANGAWAITVATPHQLQVARQFGFNRIVLANQLIGRSAIEFVLNELNRNAEFEFYCLVDSTAALEQLYRYGSGNPALKRIFVLVELGYEGGRTGCRSTDQALSIARSIVDHNKVAIKGVEGFEGLLRGSTPAESTQLVEAFLDRLVEFAQACDAEALLPAEAILSAGGSAYFDLVVARLTAARLSIEPRIVLRSGCYLTHDSLMYTKAFARMHDRSKAISDLGEGLKPAMEVWAYIQSRPEPSLAIAMLGKRDISHDEMPVPLAWHHPGSSDSPKPLASDQYRVSKLNDQHCHMLVPSDSPLSVGDLVSFGISHPCLTFDKWRVIHLVDSNYNVVDSIQTFF
jgi:D-serine dehydratase